MSMRALEIAGAILSTAGVVVYAVPVIVRAERLRGKSLSMTQVSLEHNSRKVRRATIIGILLIIVGAIIGIVGILIRH